MDTIADSPLFETVSAVMDVPAARVFDFVSKVENLPRWAVEFCKGPGSATSPTEWSAFIDKGHVDPHRLRFADERLRRVEEIAPALSARIEGVMEKGPSDFYREHPFQEPTDFAADLRSLLGGEIVDGEE